jgi:hypothetical protein
MSSALAKAEKKYLLGLLTTATKQINLEAGFAISAIVRWVVSMIVLSY